MPHTSMLLHFEEDRRRAEAIAWESGLALECIHRHRFPDGEIKLRLPAFLPEKVVILRSLDHPNE